MSRAFKVTIAILDCSNASQLSFLSKIDAQKLGNPVELAYSDIHDHLVVTGYTADKMTVLTAGQNGTFYNQITATPSTNQLLMQILVEAD